MKKIRVLVVLIAFALQHFNLFSTEIPSFSYRGYARDCNCQFIEPTDEFNPKIKVSITILKNALYAPEAIKLYGEEHLVVFPLENGVFNIIIHDGSASSSDGDWSSINLTDDLFIKIIINESSENVIHRLISIDGINLKVLYDDECDCSPEYAGLVKYKYDGNEMFFCNGYNWVNICCQQNICDPCGGVTVVPDKLNPNKYYGVIAIGSQCWLSENLNLGTISQTQTENNIIEKRCYQDSETWCEQYGGLYEWGEISDMGGICPDGWHIPKDLEWKVLEESIGMGPQDLDLFGDRYLNSSINLWNSGFNAIESYYYDDKYVMPEAWWTMDQIDDELKIYRLADESNENLIKRGSFYKTYALHVRCIKND